MAERPDSPNEPTPADAPPIEVPEDETVHHTSQRKKRKKGVGGEEIELQLTSMIDVIFQLLIYFVITANFQIDEGTILAKLPGNSAQEAPDVPPESPVQIDLTSTDDGVTYNLLVDGQSMDGVAQLSAYFQNRVGSGAMDADRPVSIKPQPKIRWQHVVNVFNACVRAELENVGFAP